jgi:hypothetical protein
MFQLFALKDPSPLTINLCRWIISYSLDCSLTLYVHEVVRQTGTRKLADSNFEHVACTFLFDELLARLKRICGKRDIV